MIVQTTTVARNTFVESLRQPIFFVLVMLSGVVQVFSTWNTGFSMGKSTESTEVTGDTKLLFDMGLATVFVCGVLLAAFIATAVISREIENRTVLTVVSKPIARATVILGKFLGAAGAILLGMVIMLTFLLLALRHGVLSTAADDADGPVLVFAFAAVAGALLFALWTNFFYGWYFTQTAMLVMLPAVVLAYVAVLLVSKKWEFQPVGKDFMPQVVTACAAMTLAILVLTAIATAVSTRLGQAMTIVVCAGFFLGGLLSNHYVGRHAFRNRDAGEVRKAEPADPTEPAFDRLGAVYKITLQQPPRPAFRIGASIYYGSSPNGVPMAVPGFRPVVVDVGDGSQLVGPGKPSALIVTAANGPNLTIQNVGEAAVAVSRPPEAGDWVFAEPPRVNPFALALWGVVPNMHFFWLVDAVGQNRPVPGAHLGLLGLYSLAQIGAFLALGVALFQGRDVG